MVDLADVAFYDSTGIGALVRARTAAIEFGIIVTIINPRQRSPASSWTSPAF